MKKSRSKRSTGGQETTLRIVGGEFRGSKLKYAGDPRVRPMKDRIREAVFNLVGPEIKGRFAMDLFGGTGALALEAVSRGAGSALVIERHLPTARVIRENIHSLQLQSRVSLVSASAFHFAQHLPDLPSVPWVVFCSPPYRFFVDRRDEVLDLIDRLKRAAPSGSQCVVEATADFDFSTLPDAASWDVRPYPPAIVAITSWVRKESETGSTGSQQHPL